MLEFLGAFVGEAIEYPPCARFYHPPKARGWANIDEDIGQPVGGKQFLLHRGNDFFKTDFTFFELSELLHVSVWGETFLAGRHYDVAVLSEQLQSDHPGESG